MGIEKGHKLRKADCFVTKPDKTSDIIYDIQVNNAVIIGSSTGGPKALYHIIPKLPVNINAAILVVQHMPPGFTRSLAEGLNAHSSVDVREANNGDRLQNGSVLVAPGGCQMTLERRGGVYRTVVHRDLSDNMYKPSVDILLESAAVLKFSRLVAVILSGMGSDGSRGIVKVRQHKGSFAIVQDRETSVVFGMPGAAVKTGKVNAVTSLDRIAAEILEFLGV